MLGHELVSIFSRKRKLRSGSPMRPRERRRWVGGNKNNIKSLSLAQLTAFSVCKQNWLLQRSSQLYAHLFGS